MQKSTCCFLESNNSLNNSFHKCFSFGPHFSVHSHNQTLDRLDLFCHAETKKASQQTRRRRRRRILPSKNQVSKQSTLSVFSGIHTMLNRFDSISRTSKGIRTWAAARTRTSTRTRDPKPRRGYRSSACDPAATESRRRSGQRRQGWWKSKVLSESHSDRLFMIHDFSQNP